MAEKVMTEKGSRSVYKIDDGSKECQTVLFMFSASGMQALPLLMYAYKENIPIKIIENTPSGWGLGHSNNGWMTGEAYYKYMTNIFYVWLVNQGIEFPVIVYMDNHFFYISISLSEFCRDKKIELIGLHPNSTHIT